MSNCRKYFKSKGPSPFIKMTHDEFIKVSNITVWRRGGVDSFRAEHLRTIETIKNKFGKGLITQIWLERPSKGYARCKFEVAYNISSMGNSENKSLREKIAGSLRLFLMRNGLPREVEEATGSTVVAIRIQAGEDDNDTRVSKNGICKIIDFCIFLDEKLNEWNNTDAINLIEILKAPNL